MILVSQEVLANLYRNMLLIRRIEERVADIYPSDKIKSPIHLSIGQEAPSVAVCAALGDQDIVFGTYRGHALYLAKGGDPKAMVAELYGKETGCGRGKAGSMHLGDRSAGVMGTSAIVSTTIPQAVGFALSEKMRGKDTIICVFFGDGATEEGVFYESLNFASLMRLPILFVCENNGYAIHTPAHKRVLKPNYCERAEVFGIPSLMIADNDALAIYESSVKAIEILRRPGSGPRFIEIETYRWREHVGPGEDWSLGYRTFQEGQSWIERDQVSRVKGLIEGDTAILDAEVAQIIDEAFAFAEESPFPSPDALYSDIYQ